MRKKMLFHEICKGSYAEEMQELFEKAQSKASKIGLPITIKNEIVVVPPKDGERRFGQIQYATELKVPKRKSLIHTTEIEKGFIVEDGTDVVDILQEKMDMPDIAEHENKDPYARSGNA